MKLLKGSVVLAAVAIGSIGLTAGSGAAATVTSSATSATASSSTTTHRQLTVRGVSNLGVLAQAQRSAPASTDANQYELAPDVPGKDNGQQASAVPVPNPPNTPISPTNGGAPGFVGITHEQQRFANNGNQLSLEPPDQGLCAHGDEVMEPVNNAIQVFNESGAALAPIVALSPFFHLPPEIDRSFNPPTFGPFLSDPRCYFDAQTSRWFVTELEIDRNPFSGAFGFRSSELIAVSQTPNPLGNYAIFQIDATNDGSDGTPALANCPCFGDQPRIGADRHGFYISTDNYPIADNEGALFNSDGGELYAVSKQGLANAANGAPPPVLVDIHNGAVIIDNEPANAVQPAETPEGGTYAAKHGIFHEHS